MPAQQRMSNREVAHKLVIVESPAKARSIEGYLGRGYVVESSVGHIRDLPQSADDIPAELKGESWARLGVNIDSDFEPVYVVSRDKKSQMTKLKGLLKDADELLLATDEDREGEAIAWHLLDELKPKVPVQRMVFHEITRRRSRTPSRTPATSTWTSSRPRRHAASSTASTATRSAPCCGARSCAVSRPVACSPSRPGSWWTASASGWSSASRRTGTSRPRSTPVRARPADVPGPAALRRREPRRSRLRLRPGRRAEAERQGRAPDQSRAGALADALHDTDFEVRSVESKPYTRRPYAPFRTTTMQQEASRKLGFGASSTMSVAQRLYEGGYITYMRTDSTTLSETAIAAARTQARDLYGAEYIPDAPRVYASKVKNAQEAHEAIRPAGDQFRTPAQTGLTGDQFRLYELIWMRTIASQMKDAQGNSVSIRLGGTAGTGEDVVFSASGRVITFHGFLKAYVEGTTTPTPTDDQETRLPNVSEGEAVTRRRSGQGARDQAAVPLHRGEPDQGAREARDRPALDVRLDRRHDPEPRLRLQEGDGAGPGVAGVLGDPAAGAALPAADRLRLHRRLEDVLDEIAGGRRDRNTS